MSKTNKLPVAKALNKELMQATFVVLVPDEVDLHGDIYDEKTVMKACHNYNLHCQKANLFHMAQTDSFSIVESYTAPVEMQLEDRIIKKGTWLATIQCNDPKLFEMIKSEEISSVSIGALASVEYLDDTN